MNTCYIVGAGDFCGGFIPKEGDLVIAADGGYTHLISHGVRCDLLIGDLDSLGFAPDGIELIKHPVEKDDTDTFLALKEGVQRGYASFEIYGGTGGREDHTLANYALLSYAARRGYRALLRGSELCAFVIKDGTVSLSAKEGSNLSVFAIGGTAHGVSIKGAKYEAENITLTHDFPLGVSNSFLSCAVEVSCQDGELLVLTDRSAAVNFN